MNMTRTLIPAALGLLALVGTACNGSDDNASARTEAFSATSETVPMPPACADVLTPGAVIPTDLDDRGCTGADGSLTFPGIWDCADGRKLLGNDGLAGYLGEPAQALEAGDDAYGVLYEECLS